MATITRGKTFISGETVEPADMHQLVDSATIAFVTADDTDDSTLEASAGKLRVKDAGITNAKLAGSVGLNAWTTKTANYTAVAGDRINADTGGGAFTITLPATPANYTEVTIADHDGDWETNNLTVARNGSNINGGAADLTCDVSGKQILLRYEGATTGWRIYT